MGSQKVRRRTGFADELRHRRRHSLSRLLNCGDGYRGFSGRKVMIERAFGSAAGIDDIVQAGTRITLPSKECDGSIHNRSSMFGNGGHNILAEDFDKKLY